VLRMLTCSDILSLSFRVLLSSQSSMAMEARLCPRKGKQL
jgi:hypothetical protein